MSMLVSSPVFRASRATAGGGEFGLAAGDPIAFVLARPQVSGLCGAARAARRGGPPGELPAADGEFSDVVFRRRPRRDRSPPPSLDQPDHGGEGHRLPPAGTRIQRLARPGFGLAHGGSPPTPPP